MTAALNPLRVSSQTAAPDTALEWHSHPHDEFWLVLDGTPLVGHSGSKACPAPGTLFLFTEGEAHGFWNLGNVPVRLWALEFRTSSSIRNEFGTLFERPPHARVLGLSALQRQRFCNTCQKIAFERVAAGFLNATAASVLLALQLIEVSRWLCMHPPTNDVNGMEKLDPQCFELWQKIHRHAFQPASPGPMLLSLDPAHDSLRHRFRRLFGISPQGMLVRLRMDRAKELLLTGEHSIKEIAHELGYLRQHDFTRAFHKCTGMSPTHWRARTHELDF
ncbi:MAG: AraC family transcriptional regulator [Verrucomicrobia bacterium]|nr:AraC family transcriptional regulator [Verrucomicrobiota bacterium]